MIGADERYAKVLEKARLDYLTNKTNSYPKTLQDCFVLLKGYIPKKQQNGHNQQKLGVAFVNDGSAEVGTALVNKVNHMMGCHVRDAGTYTPLRIAAQRGMPMVQCYTLVHSTRRLDKRTATKRTAWIARVSHHLMSPMGTPVRLEA